MPNTHATLSDLFTDIANAIREVMGTTETIMADQFPEYIRQLSYIKTPGTLLPNSTWYKGTTARSTITAINIVDSYTPTGSETESWDASVAQDESVKCYIIGTELTIAGNGSGSIKANQDSSWVFCEQTRTNDFRNVTSLTGLDILDVSEATDISHFFENMYLVQDISGISGWDTSNVTNMYSTFNCCKSITALDLNSFNTSQVTNMYCMFYECNALTSLDLSSFNTSQVTNMSFMFGNCKALITIYASSLWSTSECTNSSSMFYECTKLQGDISYNSSYVDKTYAKTSGGYLTYKAAPAA